MKCDKCDKAAKISITDIVNGEKIERHLCEDCAVSEGFTMTAACPLTPELEILASKSGALVNVKLHRGEYWRPMLRDRPPGKNTP